MQAYLQHGKPGDAESEMLALAGLEAPADLVLEGVAAMAALPGVSGAWGALPGVRGYTPPPPPLPHHAPPISTASLE